jgi:hypothetical protein
MHGWHLKFVMALCHSEFEVVVSMLAEYTVNSPGNITPHAVLQAPPEFNRSNQRPV